MVPRAVPEQRVSRLIVKLRAPSAEVARPLSATAGVNLKSVREMAFGASLLALDTALPLSEARAVAARLTNDPAVLYAVPDVMYKKLQATPTDPFYSTLQWNLFTPTSNYTGALTGGGTKSAVTVGAANLPPAWVTTTGAPAVVVAVIDSGIVNHPDLNNAGVFSGPYVPAGRFLAGYDFVSSTAGADSGFAANFTSNDGNGRDPDASDPGDWLTAAEQALYPECDNGRGPLPSSWHGSHTAGVIAAMTNNGIGIAGIGRGVTVLPVRALGKCGGSLSDIAEAIVWAAGSPVANVPDNLNPAQVINLSLGSNADIQCDGPMQDAVNFAIGRGATVVAATGNYGEIGLGSPAKCSGVIAVTAHTITGENSDFANIGVGTTISAPGGGKPTTLGAGGATDDPTWAGYYVWSTALLGLTSPDSAGSSGSAGVTYAGRAGTSGATPHVSGVAALIKSIQPMAGPLFVKSWLTAGGNVRAHPAGGACEFLLTLCGKGLLDADRALIAAVNLIPAVNAGPNQVVLPGALVTASASTTAYPPKNIVSVEWTQLNSPAVPLTGATTLNVSFTAPPSPGTVVLRFRATDTGTPAKFADDIISIRSNRPPVLGPIPAALTVTAGQVVNFTVTATDPDPNESVLFASTALPGGATFTSAGVFNWDTTNAAPMTYTFTYFATDSISPSESASVAITVNAAGTPPGGGGTPPGGGGTPPGGSPPPTGGGGGGGATPLWQLMLLAALMLGARIRRYASAG